MEALIWTREKPKVGGWYFTRTKTNPTWVSFLCVTPDGRVAKSYGGDRLCFIQTKHYEFAGPIPTPSTVVLS